MTYLTIVSGLIALIVPVLVPHLRVKEGKMKGWLNGWGILFLLAAIATGYGGVREIKKSQRDAVESIESTWRILNTVKKEALRVKPDDFQIRLISFTNSPKRGEQPEPSPIHCNASIDEAFLSFEFVGLNTPWKIGAGRGGGGEWGYRFYASNITIGGLEEYQYLSDLHGKQFRLEVPLSKIEFIPGNWRHHVDLYIKGRHFNGQLNDIGEVIIPLEFGEKDG